MTKKQIIETIFETLESQRFQDWYCGPFNDYITGEDITGESHEERRDNVREEIARIFRLRD